MQLKSCGSDSNGLDYNQTIIDTYQIDEASNDDVLSII